MSRKIGVEAEHYIKIPNNIVKNYCDAANILASAIGMAAQQSFVSLICNHEKKALGVIHHAIGGITDYSFNIDVAASSISNIDGGFQVWFGRNSPDSIINISNRDIETIKALYQKINEIIHSKRNYNCYTIKDI